MRAAPELELMFPGDSYIVYDDGRIFKAVYAKAYNSITIRCLITKAGVVTGVIIPSGIRIPVDVNKVVYEGDQINIGVSLE